MARTNTANMTRSQGGGGERGKSPHLPSSSSSSSSTPPPLLLLLLLLTSSSVLLLNVVADAAPQKQQQPPTPPHSTPALWPWPRVVYAPDLSVPIDLRNFTLDCEVDNPCPAKLLSELDRYTNLVKHSCANKVYPDSNAATIDRSSAPPITSCSVILGTADETLAVDTDVTFAVKVGQDPFPYCEIEAKTLYGAYYGFQTLAQLCDTSNATSALRVAQIKDEPRFDFRGLLVDTARHFVPVAYLKRVVDIMSLHRLNVLHWHIVDSQAFPAESKTFPDLTKAAYHPKAVYTTEDMADIVAYANSRGVVVMPEFDVPGHGSWGAGYPDLMGCPSVLDPINPDVYTFLGAFLGEMAEIFPSEYVFLGGDEVNASCWSDNPKIARWLDDHKMTDADLFDYFWQNVTTAVLPALAGRKIGVWQSNKIDIKPGLLPKGSFGNVWQSPKMMKPIIDAGMPVVLSGTYYLDQQQSITGAGACKEYAWQQTWKCMYQEEPLDQIDEAEYDMLMGLEVAMWGEGVNQFDFETRVVSRLAAVAERMWVNRDLNNLDGAEIRLDRHICRLNLMGIHAGPIKPSFCLSDLDDY